MKILLVDLPGRSYPIYIGSGLLARAGELTSQHIGTDRVFIVSDENVWPLYGRALVESFADAGVQAARLVLPPGEGSKSSGALERIWNAMASSGHRRTDALLALGGGVIGDLAGFAASTYMRGVPFVQVPTTLLAQVDSSVGGKVAINLESGKNLAGAFYQPSLVISDISVLSSLPGREYAVGMAEVIKYAVLFDPPLLEDLSDRIEDTVYQCCDFKRKLVVEDEHDRGERMLLNFGHTFGHAIEKAGGYAAHTHGEAVAIGMILAAKASRALGVSKTDLAPALERALLQYGLPTACPFPWDTIVSGMTGDKKNSGDDITLILLSDLGKPVIRRVSVETLLKLGGALG